MKNTLTERDIYTAMLNGTLDAEVAKEFAEKKIAQLDRRNAGAKVRAERKRAENSGVVDAVYALVGTEPQTRDAIATAYGDETMSVAKIGAKLNALVSEGRIQKTTIKVVNAEGKNVSKVAYFRG